MSSFDLQWTRVSQCSDVRDKVYGILSLVDGGSDFHVDYNDDPYSLCCRATQSFDMSHRTFYDMLEAMNID